MNQFDTDHFQHLLGSLTINSRAVITELTAIAEANIDHCNDIGELIEARIKKCLPQHKLNAMYLMDSICKNVGSPYNIIFGKNLFKTFTDTYSIVTDTPTRQNLINLFKTWPPAKTNTGSELFPSPVLAKIENFIIKATSLNAPGLNVTYNNMTIKLTTEMVFKEARSLLQYVISLAKFDEILPLKYLTADQQALIKKNELRQNQLVLIINDTTDSLAADLKSDTDVLANIKRYQTELQNIRKELDDQFSEQDKLLKDNKPLIQQIQQKEVLKKNRIEDRRKKHELLERNKITIDPKPDMRFFTDVSKDIRTDVTLLHIVECWGKKPVTIVKVDEPKPRLEPKPVDLSMSLGMNFSFGGSILDRGEDKEVAVVREPTPEVVEVKVEAQPELYLEPDVPDVVKSPEYTPRQDEDDLEDDYTPMLDDKYTNGTTSTPSVTTISLPPRPVFLRSSIKRRAPDSTTRPVKRVRFDIA